MLHPLGALQGAAITAVCAGVEIEEIDGCVLLFVPVLRFLQDYKALKSRLRLYDRPDLVHHLYQHMSRAGYTGCAITHITRWARQRVALDEFSPFLRNIQASVCHRTVMHIVRAAAACQRHG
jgi:hypothetical protein